METTQADGFNGKIVLTERGGKCLKKKQKKIQQLLSLCLRGLRLLGGLGICVLSLHQWWGGGGGLPSYQQAFGCQITLTLFTTFFFFLVSFLFTVFFKRLDQSIFLSAPLLPFSLSGLQLV